MRAYTTSEYLKVISLATLHARWFYKNPWRSPDEIRDYQEKQIKRLIAHAYQTTDFYRNKYKKAGVQPEDFKRLEDLNKFPTLTKDEIIANFPGAVVSKSVEAENCIHSVSSGSSGKVITILHDPKDTWSYALGRFRILNILKNYRPWDKSLYIYTSPYPATSYFGLYPSYFISTLNNLSDTAEKIIKLKPAIISSYPSQMIELMKCFTEKEAKDLKIKLISLGSELSTRSQRDLLSQYFNCAVYDEYSSEELGWIAGECQQLRYHLWEDISYIEILKPDSDEPTTEGEIVGTNLHNFAMPFIRYRQGDLGKVAGNSQCSCGRKLRLLDSFLGRSNDTFKFADGKILQPAYLLDAVYSLLLDEKANIADFCLIQESTNNVRMQIVRGQNFLETEIPKIKNRLEKLLPANVIMESVLPGNLYKTLSGKRNPIISKIGVNLANGNS